VEVQCALLRWIMAFGPPQTLQSNNGTEFCNSLVTGLAEEHGFKISHGRPYHPQAQGLVEQGNGVITSRLSKWRADTGREDW
jgi:transposase InsO family protein